jgi:asparagine synthase (glutamine-hydrolysing)
LEINKTPGEPENPDYSCSPEEAVWHLEEPSGGGISNVRQPISNPGSRVYLTGHWGDQVLFGLGYLIDLTHRFKWREVWQHLQEISRWSTDTSPQVIHRLFLEELLKAHVPHRLVPLLRRLRDKLAPTVATRSLYTKAFREMAYHVHGNKNGRGWHTAHGRLFYQEIRSRLRVFNMEYNNKLAAMNGLEMSYPFLDRDLVAFMMSIPGEIQAWQGVPKILLRQGLRGTLPRAIGERRWKADFTQVFNNDCLKSFDNMINLLKFRKQAVQRGYIDGDMMHQKLTRLHKGIMTDNCTTAWSLQKLVGLEMWLQVFFGN